MALEDIRNALSGVGQTAMDVGRNVGQTAMGLAGLNQQPTNQRPSLYGDISQGDRFRALGAAVGGRLPQFEQQLMQENQMRQAQGMQSLQMREALAKTIAQDAQAGLLMAQSGDTQGFIDLIQDRIRLERQMGMDSTESENTLRDFQTGGFGAVLYDLQRAVAMGQQSGYFDDVPQTFRALEMQADAAGLPKGSAERREFMLYGGADSQMGASKTISFGNGVFIEKPRIGPQKVYDRTGNLVTDPNEIRAVLNEANEFGIVEAGLMASEKARGTATEGRNQEVLDTGIRAARNMQRLQDAVKILEVVETGGIASLGIKLRRSLGITPADEGRLAYILRKNVLQQLKPTFGAAFTAREGDLLASIEANENQSTAVNRDLLNDLISYSQLDIDRAKLRGKQMGESGEFAIQDMDGYLQQNFYPLDELKLNGDLGAGGGEPLVGRDITVDANGNIIDIRDQ